MTLENVRAHLRTVSRTGHSQAESMCAWPDGVGVVRAGRRRCVEQRAQRLACGGGGAGDVVGVDRRPAGPPARTGSRAPGRVRRQRLHQPDQRRQVLQQLPHRDVAQAPRRRTAARTAGRCPPSPARRRASGRTRSCWRCSGCRPPRRTRRSGRRRSTAPPGSCGETPLIVVPSGRQTSPSAWNPGSRPGEAEVDDQLDRGAVARGQPSGTSPVTWNQVVLHGAPHARPGATGSNS